MSLKTIASAVLLERQPFAQMVRLAHRGERAFDRIRAPQVLPMLGWEVVEGEQRIAILGQAFDRLVVFRSVALRESVESCDGLVLRFGHALTHAVSVPQEKADTIMPYEVYASPEAFQTHWNGTSIQQMRQDVAGLQVSLKGVRCNLVE